MSRRRWTKEGVQMQILSVVKESIIYTLVIKNTFFFL